MPEEVEFYPKEQILTYEELLRLARIATRLGVDKIRLTGGEPLVRRDVPILVRALAELGTLRDLSLTTNGVRLAELARPLREAGLKRLNVSLDSLDQQRFAQLTRRHLFPAVIEGVEGDAGAGLSPIEGTRDAM